MAWNEPGKDDQDPWSGRRRKPEGPPNIDVVLGKFFKRVFGVLGGKPGGGGASSLGSGQGMVVGLVVLIVLLLIWALSGIYIVDPMEQGVVLRFGRFEETVNSGPHWLPRFIESVRILNTTKVSTFTYGSEMLTKEANIIYVSIAVQYRISNPENFLFSNTDPVETIQQSTASALRQVIGHSGIDSIMTSGRALIRQQVQVQLEKVLSNYHVGLQVKDVTMQPARAPSAVKDAFDEAIKAQEKEQQIINVAQAYAKTVIPKAQGDAKRLLADSTAYQARITLAAQGDVARFLAILPRYKQAPVVTRERMYLDTMESVLGKSSKILLDSKGSNNVLYLPLDKLINQSMNSHQSTAGAAARHVSGTNAAGQSSDALAQSLTNAANRLTNRASGGSNSSNGSSSARYRYGRNSYDGRGSE